jgi:hypothetical protein
MHSEEATDGIAVDFTPPIEKILFLGSKVNESVLHLS